MDIKRRCVTGTRKPLFIGNPRNAAAKVSAFSVHREKAAIVQSNQVELAVGERRDTTRFETIHGPGDPHVRCQVLRCLTFPGHERRHCKPASLQQCNTPKHAHRTRKKTPPVLVYICHGHTSAMPAPLNHTPVAVRIAKETKSSTNSDCTASFLVAAKNFLTST